MWHADHGFVSLLGTYRKEVETPKAVLAETGPGGKPSIRRNFEEETRTLPNDFRKIQGGTPRNLINKYNAYYSMYLYKLLMSNK